MAFLLVFGLTSPHGLCAQGEFMSKQPLNIGEIHVIHSAILQEDRTLNIYLPDGFHQDSMYSVIYLLDGSMNENFIHIAGLTQFFNLMFTMPGCIVVGIANVDRKRDYTHETLQEDLLKRCPTCGHSDAFIGFVEKELLPYVESTFKVNEQRMLIGQSLGGLLASEFLLKKADLFTHYFIVSPSL